MATHLHTESIISKWKKFKPKQNNEPNHGVQPSENSYEKLNLFDFDEKYIVK